MKTRPVGDELLHADRRTDMTKTIVAFRNFANVPNKRRTSVTLAEFETRDPKNPMCSDLRLRPHGHWDRPKCIFKCDTSLRSKRTKEEEYRKSQKYWCNRLKIIKLHVSAHL